MKTTLRLTVAAFGLVTFTVSAATLHVSLESPNPVSPYATWTTAATSIQDAVDAAKDGDTVLVTNGVYRSGGRAVNGTTTNRVAVTKPLALLSVNGPDGTIIEGHQVPDTTNGDGAARCVYLAADAFLSGFTLTGGGTASSTNVTSADQYGGGVFCDSDSAIVSNCVVVANAAYAYGGGVWGGRLYNCTLERNSVNRRYGGGGGAKGATLYNCLLTKNSAEEGNGGGAEGCTLYNCLLIGNWALSGGGVFGGTLYSCTVVSNSASNGGGVIGAITPALPVYGILNNCVVFYNTATNGPNFGNLCLLDHCCTEPLSSEGIGNINTPPLFRDSQNGDFRLSASSPCIDAGRNLVGFTITLPPFGPFGSRTLAYDCDPTDMFGNTRFIDGNGDGIVAWDIGAYEFNSFKPPHFTTPPQLTANGWMLSLTGPTNKWVHVQRSSDLKNWEDIWSGWMGAAGGKQVDDADTSQKAMFYRAVVE